MVDESSSSALRLASALRLGAVALLVVGFSGWAIDDGVRAPLESPYTVAFLAGVICAAASIYIGVFLANGGE